MLLLATRETYYKRTIHAGEEFECLDRHAKTLKALRHCVDAPPKVPQPTANLSTKEVPPMVVRNDGVLDLDAAPVKPMTTEDAKAIVPQRRGYNRRDMRPGETGASMPAEPGTAADNPEAG